MKAHRPSDLELVGAGAFALRATWMLYPDWHSLPLEVQGYLIPPWFTEGQWGLVLLALALLQFIAGTQRGNLLRGTVATAAAMVQGMAVLGYYRSGELYRGVVPLVLVVVVVEMVIAVRAWDALRDTRRGRYVERRR